MTSLIKRIIKTNKHKKACQPKFLCPVNIFIKNENELKMYSERNLMEFVVPADSTVQEMVRRERRNAIGSSQS